MSARGQVFQETIELANGRVIWIIFVTGVVPGQLPVAAQKDALERGHLYDT